MFVVKNSPVHDAINVIAGEMLNREMSINHFVNGEPRKELPSDYIGYPSYNSGLRKYTLRLVSSTIYVPANVDLEQFAKIIEDKIVSKGNIIRLDGHELSAKCSHKVGENFCTAILAVPDKLRKFNFEDGSRDDGKSVRFVWRIRHISKIELSVLGKQPDSTIRRLAGIFWDADDILNLPHGTLTFEFSDKSFKAHDRMCDENALTLYPAATNPLLFELNRYWQESVPGTDAKDFMRDVNRRKLVSAHIDQVEIKPVRVDDESATMSSEICFRCKEPLYGEVYGLSGYITKQDEPVINNGKVIVTPICTLCLHTTPEDSPLESKFIRVIRLQWKRTPLDMINIYEMSEKKADICREVLKKLTPCVTKIDDKDIKYYLIGDKYVGFQHNGDFRYTKMVNAPFLNGREACKVVIVQ